MRALSHCLVAALVGTFLASHAAAAGPGLLPASPGKSQAVRIKWSDDLQKAAQLAQKSGKPILVQFTADWCTFCHKMLDETLSKEAIAKQVNECFIPVVLDADENEQIVAALGVEAFPTTVIISPDLKSANRLVGFFRPAAFETKLEPYCRETRARLADAKQPNDADKKDQPAKPKLTLGFEGLCLVSLLDDRKQHKGSKDITAVYNNMQLRFSSEARRRAFLANPEKYWPMLDGHCPVASSRREKDTIGTPSTVAVYRGRLLLFRSMKHRDDFAGDPRGFIEQMAARDQPGPF